jgi:branched-chain amino acid transport system substrate-binding protein
MPFYASYEGEGRIFASYIIADHPGARIGVLYQNDDYGKGYLKGLRDGLGAKAESMIVMAAPYEVADTTVDSQMVGLKAAGVDVFVEIAIPKFVGVVAMGASPRSRRWLTSRRMNTSRPPLKGVKRRISGA